MEEPRLSDFKIFYEVEGSAFASGLYASVRRARSRKTGQLYAAKFSPKRKENINEIRLLSRLNNNYIISFKDAFQTEKNLITIMEFAPGGDLQSVLDADIVLPESQASKYITQLLLGLDYLHSKSIAHLDIKPQNLLLMGDFPDCQIKICDFELSRVIGNGVKEIVGTPDYVAPEILACMELTTRADIWSTGIVTYVLLTGFSPFGADSDAETFNNILNSEIDFPNELFDDISLSAIDFTRALLEKNPRSRPTSRFALSNEWFKSYRTRSRNKSKSTFDLSGGKTKSREKLMQRVIGAGLRKTMSKSREQLWRSKMQLSASSEKIARWASVSEFPSLNDEVLKGTAVNTPTLIPEDLTKPDLILLPHTPAEESVLLVELDEQLLTTTLAGESNVDSELFNLEIIGKSAAFVNHPISDGAVQSDLLPPRVMSDENGQLSPRFPSTLDPYIQSFPKSSSDLPHNKLDESLDIIDFEIQKHKAAMEEEAMHPRRSVKDLIQAFSRNDIKNLEVIDEEGEDQQQGSWGRRYALQKIKLLQ